MSISNKLKSSGQWQSFEVVVLMIVQFGYFAVMARLLEKSDFGFMAIANSIIVFGNIFAESGMGSAIIQKKGLTQKHINAALQGSLLTGAGVFIIIFISSTSIATFFSLPELQTIIKVIAVNYLLLSLSSVPIGLLHRNYLFKQSSIVTVISIISAYSVGIVLALDDYGVWSLVYASVLYNGLKMIGYFIVAQVNISLSVNLKEWKELYSFGFGMVLLKVMNYMSNGGLIIILGKIFSPQILGVFERTFNLKSLPSNHIGSIIDKIMFPVMSEIQDEKEKIFSIYIYGLGISNAILMPLSVYLIYFSREIVLILLGEKWIEAVIPLQIMFVVISFSISSRMADSVIRAKGYVYKNAFRKLIYVSTLLISAGFGGYCYGIIGTAVAITISQIINYYLMIVLVKKIFNKNTSEILFNPVRDGVKLTILLTPLLCIHYIIDKYFVINEIILYLIITLMTTGTALYILIKHPHLCGHYLGDVLSRYKN